MPDEPATYRRLSPDERRRELLAFGRRHFAKHAFDAMSLTEIAEQAGVSKGTLYKYFGGRRGFYVATIETVVDEVLELLVPPDEEDLDEALAIMTRDFVGYARENRGIYLALIRGGLGADPEIAAQLDRVRHHALTTIEELAGASPDPELRRIAIYGWFAFVETATAEWLASDGVDVGRLVPLFRNALAVAIAGSSQAV